MSTAHWDRVRELFEQVADLPADQRRRLLDEQCAHDPALRNEILSLLEHDERAAPEFLVPPALPPYEGGIEGGEESERLVGTRVGKYHVKRLIASGGMGTVYEAEQDHPRRTVAIKVMHAWAHSKSIRRRFEFEVETLARLTDPNIARIYDADTIPNGVPQAGAPYFVMEYVPDAQTIIAFAEQRGLDTPARLELFLQACDAVQHGHQKGIIHRDLKPANILVSTEVQDDTALSVSSAEGIVKVIDFGVAQAVNADAEPATRFTETGQLLGTIQYMSPEQCEGDPRELDVRTDVYSLGVVLYQLLCGRLPYSRPTSTLTQAVRAICDDSPVPPREANREVRGNLEFVLLKALEKGLNRRYQSVADLARDIRHVLAREPIAARPPTLATSFTRWVARHPIASTALAAATAGTAVLVGFYVAIWLVHDRPHHIEISADGREAVLVSASGVSLHSWKSTEEGGIRAGLVVTKPGAPASRLAIIAFGEVDTGPLRARLCAFDVARLDVASPVWCNFLRENDTPPTDRPGFTPGNFGVQKLWSYDIFEDIPGDELVTSSANFSSLRVLRVVDLDGRTIYQVWHQGGLFSARWLPRAGALVFSGENSAVYWKDREYPGAEHVQRTFPYVVFALRPVSGFVSNALVSEYAQDDQLRPLWYRCLLPPEATDVFDLPTIEPSIVLKEYDADWHIAVKAPYIKEPGAMGYWMLDQAGNTVSGAHVPNDPYLRNPQLPRMEAFSFKNLPPPRAP